MFHCEASLVEDVDDVADVRRFFYTTNYITLEKNDAFKRMCMIGGKIGIR